MLCPAVELSASPIRTVRDGEPRTATSTFTQPLSSDRNPHLPSALCAADSIQSHGAADSTHSMQLAMTAMYIHHGVQQTINKSEVIATW